MPRNICHKITFTKYFAAHFQKVSALMIINGNENDTVVRQHIPGQHQPGIHHAAPVGVKPGITLCVLYKVLVALFVK